MCIGFRMIILIVATLPVLASASIDKDASVNAQVNINNADMQLDKLEYKAAKAAYEQALVFAEKAIDWKLEGKALVGISNSLCGMNEFQAAKTFALRSLELFQKHAEPSGEAGALNLLGNINVRLRKMDDVESYYKRALSLYLAIKDRSGEAETLFNLGCINSDLGQGLKALPLFQQSLAIYVELRDRKSQVNVLTKLCWAKLSTGNGAEALGCAERALSISNELHEERLILDSLYVVGMVSSRNGQYDRAIECYEKTMVGFRKLEDRDGEASTLFSLGRIYEDRGHSLRAKEYFEKTREIFHSLGNPRKEAASIRSIANQYLDLGQHGLALELYEKALVLDRQIGDLRSEAADLGAIGCANNEIGQAQTSLGWLKQSLKLRKETGDRKGEAAVWNNMGGAYAILGQKLKAVECFEEALALWRSLGDKKGEAATLGIAAQAYADLGQADKAIGYLKSAIPISQSMGDRNTESINLVHMASVYAELGEWKKVRESIEPAVAIICETQNKTTEASASDVLRRFADAQGQSATAVLHGKRGLNAYQEIRNGIRKMQPAVRRDFLRKIERTYRVLADRLLKLNRPIEAHQIISLLKEQEYFDYTGDTSVQKNDLLHIDLLSAESRVETGYQSKLDTAAKIGIKIIETQMKKQHPAETEVIEKLLFDYTSALESIRKSLSSMDSDLNEQSLTTPDPLIPIQIRDLWRDLRAMPAGTAAVYTLMAEECLWLMAVTPGDVQTWQVKIPRRELEALVRAFSTRVQNPRLDTHAEGKKLYDILLTPLKNWRRKQNIQRILWSLDGPLRYIPVGALWNGKSYFIEELPTAIFTPAARMSLGKVEVNRRVLGVGVSKSIGDFPALPYVPAELGSVVEANQSATASAGTMLIDESFTEASMRNALKQGFSVLHVASHFQLSPEGEKGSFLLLGDGSKMSLESMRSTEGLFKGVELLVLSGCRTGSHIEDPMGKEIEGFGVMAQRQGVKSVIASLWPIADVSTCKLMQDFYRSWSNADASKEDSLRKAQLSLLKGVSLTGEVTLRGKSRSESMRNRKTGHTALAPALNYSHPFYWASFVLMGNWQ
jgi:CHAT domain-containing protein/Tfp pilus assembly protein PilF